MARAKTYDGQDISISFDMKRCVHARNCFLKLPDVFDPSRRPWVDPDAASADAIAAMIQSCPSGALSYERKDGVADEPAPGSNFVKIQENGPLEVHGDIQIGDDQMKRATLCRCGLSKNKPYCDYSHVEGGFEATGECGVTTKDSAEGRGGPLVVTGMPNGSLKVAGNAEIINGGGKGIAKTKTAFLCRCGQSKNKPFCDGSHKEADFTTDD